MTNIQRPDAEIPPSGAAPVSDAEAITTKERSQLQLVMLRFMRHRLAVGSVVLLLLIIAFAFLGPVLWEYDHRIHRDVPSSQPPSLAHPFGTTSPGQDMMGLVMRGTQQSLKVAGLVGLIVAVTAALWGAIAGLLGGWVDSLMMRAADVILVIPPLALVAAVAGNVRGGTTWLPIALIIGFFGWPLYARVIRGVVLSLREQEFIEAARAMGASDARIVLRHLLPNVTGPLIVTATVVMAIAILAEAGLSFLGLGIQPPDTSLGQQVFNALTAMRTRPWLFYPPGIMVLLICLTINFIGDGLRDALDPRQTMVRR
ncbi:ABC transporter permease [Natronosporangium hydrolyticum]|uniref:ABC transporter permease n=1 Tax=Natronosporangium hydrolyticum TaxID=2811111 RepID=A0A895YES2_9ACTN|nr:ABC transporter permease [Natronosporangium hydrolyticum]QSB13899.1 ABC transporter permease [Natronosporangium hydrolyticum]